MADEQNREREELESANEPEANGADSPAPDGELSRGHWLSRRNLLIAALVPLVILVLVIFAGFIAVRTGYVGRYIEARFVEQMDKIGVRTEIGAFETTFAPLGVRLRDVNLYDKATGEKLAFVKYLKLDATVTDLYAANFNRTIRLDSTEVEGLEAWVTFDEEGRSNFSRLQIPEQEESNLRFNYNTMKFALRDSLVHYGDRRLRLSGEARNVAVFIEPQEGLSETEREIENRRFKFDVSASNSTLTYDNRPVEPIDVQIRGVATETYAEIAELNLKSPVASTKMTGRLEDWENLKYRLNIIESSVDLQQAGAILNTEQALRGVGNFAGTIEGAGENYQITGEIVSDALAADNIRLKGLRASASINGAEETYEANGRVIAELLTYGDFQLNAMQLAGNVMGTGTDFRWLGELRAAAARFPDGTVASLILSDAAAEYRDGKLDATVGSVLAASGEAFDAKFRAARAANVKIRNADGATDVTVGNVRADSLDAQGTRLRGVNAANVRVRDREDAPTNVEIGNLQAQNLQTEGGTNLQDLTAGGVTINTRGKAVDVTADRLTAQSVQDEDVRIRDLRARGIDLTNVGKTTDVTAQNVQIGGLQTAQATLGSLNIAGVRLRVVGERIEGTSANFNAGNVALKRSEDLPEGGSLRDVRVARPVFVLEPSGRYRASLDLSLGGGALGAINVGAARASVVATNAQVELSNLNAQVLEGAVRGDAVIALENRGSSRINATFENLDVAKLTTLAGGQAVPIAGKTTGEANLSFPGTNFRRASGTLNADVVAEAGNDARGRVPLTGRLGLRATNGLFDVETARFNTEKSEFSATGRFDLEGENSNLQLALNSSDAGELQRLVSALDVAPLLDKQLAEYNIQIAGNLTFNGSLRGKLTDPTIEGRASLETVSAGNEPLGSLSTDLFVSPAVTELRNGSLAETNGGSARFDLTIPRTGQNQTAVVATLDRVNAGRLLGALSIEGLPDFVKRINAETSGRVELSGIPNALQGFAELSAPNGTIAGETFSDFNARVQINDTLARIERFGVRFGEGTLTATGTYEGETSVFDLAATAQNIPISKVRAFLGENATSFPNLSGVVNLTARGTGELLDPKTYDINFDGTGQNIALDDRAIGNVTIVGRTANQQLNANLTAEVGGQQQTVAANVNLADENLPFRAETAFNNTDLAPLAAILQPEGTVALGGRATGTATFGGNLRSRNAAGELVFSTENLRGTARFSKLDVQVEDVILSAVDPLAVSFTASQITFDSTRFIGSGSDLNISGTAFFGGAGQNNLAVNGRINLRILNGFAPDQFFAGFANISTRVSGTTENPRFVGSASLENAAFTTLVSDTRLSLTNLNGQILFNSNQVQVSALEGRLGGGRVLASGGATLSGFTVQGFRLDVRGNGVSVPLPPDFRTTGDVELQIGGARRETDNQLATTITGDIFAKRIEYTRDINLSDFLSSRQTGALGGSIGGGGGSASGMGATRVNIRVEGRDALVVRNNIADITGSVSLRVTGDASEPVIAGRVAVTQGNVVLLNDQRYDIQRGFVDFPAQYGASPTINLLATADIGAYQVFLGAEGSIAEPEALNVTLRSNPGLPQADVISLVTTGNLTDTEGGIPSLAQTGINTAAGVLTESVINAPIRRATDRLFGLNRFEIDPVLAGRRGINPGARLTVGRQINRNLSVTYSTNLSADRNQVVALEYRVSNRVSFVAQYEQAPLTNVTRRGDNFSFEVRFRRRF
jgi:translocation and assembly module TamB